MDANELECEHGEVEGNEEEEEEKKKEKKKKKKQKKKNKKKERKKKKQRLMTRNNKMATTRKKKRRSRANTQNDRRMQWTDCKSLRLSVCSHTDDVAGNFAVY